MTLTTIKQSLNEKESEKDKREKNFLGGIWTWTPDSLDSKANTLLLLPPSTSRKKVDIKHGVSKYERDLYDVTSS